MSFKQFSSEPTKDSFSLLVNLSSSISTAKTFARLSEVYTLYLWTEEQDKVQGLEF
jgi:hypothetical protein